MVARRPCTAGSDSIASQTAAENSSSCTPRDPTAGFLRTIGPTLTTATLESADVKVQTLRRPAALQACRRRSPQTVPAGSETRAKPAVRSAHPHSTYEYSAFLPWAVRATAVPADSTGRARLEWWMVPRERKTSRALECSQSPGRLMPQRIGMARGRCGFPIGSWRCEHFARPQALGRATRVIGPKSECRESSALIVWRAWSSVAIVDRMNDLGAAASVADGDECEARDWERGRRRRAVSSESGRETARDGRRSPKQVIQHSA